MSLRAAALWRRSSPQASAGIASASTDRWLRNDNPIHPEQTLTCDFQPGENVMGRFVVSQFDRDTFVVIDLVENRELCVCGNYDGGMDAEKRASDIVLALNSTISQDSR